MTDWEGKKLDFNQSNVYVLASASKEIHEMDFKKIRNRIMKLLICDTLNSKVLEELQSLGECTDISSSESKDQDLALEITDAEIVVIRSSTQLTKQIIHKKLKRSGIK